MGMPIAIQNLSLKSSMYIQNTIILNTTLNSGGFFVVSLRDPRELNLNNNFLTTKIQLIYIFLGWTWCQRHSIFILVEYFRHQEFGGSFCGFIIEFIFKTPWRPKFNWFIFFRPDLTPIWADFKAQPPYLQLSILGGKRPRRRVAAFKPPTWTMLKKVSDRV